MALDGIPRSDHPMITKDCVVQDIQRHYGVTDSGIGLLQTGATAAGHREEGRQEAGGGPPESVHAPTAWQQWRSGPGFLLHPSEFSS
ncbi:hypothetical protein D4764_14G0001410 [Takifugu flavidus]|uniref:Uncharacterized protein n=1 Tax=Takifugu flavidus TaxID=433684 RepID=A0A5C6P7F2_9TELE|nr:hypothetical protein D4764_14G0001410 [Takifugu flavidus]